VLKTFLVHLVKFYSNTKHYFGFAVNLILDVFKNGLISHTF